MVNSNPYAIYNVGKTSLPLSTKYTQEHASG